MRKVAFWLNDLGERGTAVAVYDYAYFNQHMFNNQSYILYEKDNQFNIPEVIDKFQKQFIIHGFNNFSEVDQYLKQHDITTLYIIKSGADDKKVSKFAKTFVHCVFDCTQPHGDTYAAISDSVVGWESNIPVLPHMINLPDHSEDMRTKLSIPKDATVFGRYGGKHQFNISGIHTILFQIACNNPNLYFIFANTEHFCPPLRNIIHLNTITDLHEKRKFINTCDAMLWARSDGETFGLSIGEFSTCNKPIIAYKHENISSNFHIKTLKNNALWFRTADEFMKILTSFNRESVKQKYWNMYTEYTPEKVMNIFRRLVLEDS
jgi:hypothetical protein